LRPARGGQGGQLPWPSRGRGHWRHVSPGSGVGRAVSAVLGSWAHFLTGRHGGLQGTRPDRVVGRCGLAVWRGWPGGALAVRWQGSNALVPCWRCVFPRHVFQGRRSTASRSPMGWPGLGPTASAKGGSEYCSWACFRAVRAVSRWFMGFVERQAPRRYRMVVYG
jgi:hypothetical protein